MTDFSAHLSWRRPLRENIQLANICGPCRRTPGGEGDRSRNALLLLIRVWRLSSDLGETGMAGIGGKSL
jgi:hypothetical protein